MLNRTSNTPESIKNKHLRSFLVETRALLVEAQQFFIYPSPEPSIHREIEKTIHMVDHIGRQLDESDQKRSIERRFFS